MHLRRSYALILALVCFAAQTESHGSKSEDKNAVTDEGNEDVRSEEEPRGEGAEAEETTRKRRGSRRDKRQAEAIAIGAGIAGGVAAGTAAATAAAAATATAAAVAASLVNIGRREGAPRRKRIVYQYVYEDDIDYAPYYYPWSQIHYGQVPAYNYGGYPYPDQDMSWTGQTYRRGNEGARGKK